MSPDSEPNTSTKLVGYVFNLVTNLADGQQLTISGNLALGATKEEMGVEFDKLLAVMNRLSAKNRLVLKRGEIAASKTRAAAMRKDIAIMDTKYEDTRMPTAEANIRSNLLRTIQHEEMTIASMEEQLHAIELEAV